MIFHNFNTRVYYEDENDVTGVKAPTMKQVLNELDFLK